VPKIGVLKLVAKAQAAWFSKTQTIFS